MRILWYIQGSDVYTYKSLKLGLLWLDNNISDFISIFGICQCVCERLIFAYIRGLSWFTMKSFSSDTAPVWTFLFQSSFCTVHLKWVCNQTLNWVYDDLFRGSLHLERSFFVVFNPNFCLKRVSKMKLKIISI